MHVCKYKHVHLSIPGPCRLESELKSLQEQLSEAPRQHQVDSLQSSMATAQSSLQEARSQLQEKDDTASHLQEQLIQVRQGTCVYMYMCMYIVLYMHKLMVILTVCTLPVYMYMYI